MAFPTVVDFRIKFPELATIVDDLEVQNMLNTGAVILEEISWEPRDWQTAALMWTAHWLSILADEEMRRDQGSSTSTGGGSSTGGSDLYVRMIRYEGKMIAYNERKPRANIGGGSTSSWTGPGEESMTTTSYGQLYLTLQHRNFIPIAVV